MLKTITSLSLFLFIPFLSHTQEVHQSPSIDEKIDTWIAPATKFIEDLVFYPINIGGHSIPFILIWLIVGAIIFTFYLKFINIRGFRLAIEIVRGKYTHAGDPGEVSHFQALSAALSGTVGLGNIAGVAIAISLGGPGAVFWMILAGFFGMTAKFVECALAVKFRNVHVDGSVSGGPMYYLSKGLAEKGWGRFGKFLAIFFSIMCVGASIGAGNMFQINQAGQQFLSLSFVQGTIFDGNAWLFGLIIAIILGSVIIGGIKSIAKVTEKIVPFMCGLYVVGAIVVIIANYTSIPQAFREIIYGAFDGTAVAGGLVGVLIQGIRRAAFSNESGIGSAAIAHAAVKTSEPITEGFVAALEPFVDTVIICTMTALVIVVTGVYKTEAQDGIALTSNAFATVIDWFPYVLSLAVILFAFSTMLSWSYYGLKAWTYLFGKGSVSSFIYKFSFCTFVIVGASMNLNNFIGFSDGMLFAMSLPNIIGLYVLVPLVKKDMISFLKRTKNDTIKTYDYNE
jgi:AGCS family alanine or glycine:cation symporter